MPAREAELLVADVRSSSSGSEGEGSEGSDSGKGGTWPSTPRLVKWRCPEDDRRETALRVSRAIHLSYNGGPADGPDGLPEELRTILVEGAREPGDPLHGVPPDPAPPPWYDEQLFLEGQRVANFYYAGLAEAELLTLFLLFATPSGLDPLVGTGKSDTPEAAGRRYMSTALRLQSWYTSDPFDAASECQRHLRAVRRLHAHVRRTLYDATPEELAVRFAIGKDQPRPLMCPMTPFLQEVFAKAACPAMLEVQVDRYRRPFLTQAEMSATQFGFFGLFILYPHLFAAPHITRREMEALVYTWAVLGHCLGIQDRFNWCLGGLGVVLKRSELYLNVFNVPYLQRFSPEWEHMSRCMVDGMRAYVPLSSFESNLAYLTCDVLRLDETGAASGAHAVRKALTWRQTLGLWRLRLFMQFLPRIWPSIALWMSRGLRRLLSVRFRELKLAE